MTAGLAQLGEGTYKFALLAGVQGPVPSRGLPGCGRQGLVDQLLRKRTHHPSGAVLHRQWAPAKSSGLSRLAKPRPFGMTVASMLDEACLLQIATWPREGMKMGHMRAGRKGSSRKGFGAKREGQVREEMRAG